jgi:hypothetical protein
MSIRKKFVGNAQIDGDKIQLLNNQALAAQNSSGSAIELLKFDSSNKLQMLQSPYIAAAPSDALQLANKGYIDSASSTLQTQINDSKPYHELHVNLDYTSGSSDGSIYKPFTSIQAAVNAASALAGANTHIMVHNPRTTTITENVTINNFVQNLFIEGMGSVKDGNAISLSGSITISGTSIRVRLKNFQISNAASACLTVNGTQGRHIFEKMAFVGGGGVTLTGTYSNWITFQDCSIEGPCSVGGTPAANTLVSFYGLFGGACALTVSATNAIVSMYETYSIYSVTHSAGTLSLNRFGGIQSTFASTATSSNGALFLANGSLQKGDLSFAALNKSGTAPYQLVNVHRNEAIDTLTGARISFGPTATDASYKMAVSGDWTSAVSAVAPGLDQLASRVKSAETAIPTKIASTEKGANSGVATLDSTGKIPTTQLPNLAITETFVVNSQAAMLALTAQMGDVAVRTDVSKSFILAGSDPSVLSNWQELLSPASPVQSVNGKTGTVTLSTDDVSQGSTNKYYTASQARTDVLSSSVTSGDTTHAPTADAIKTYVDNAVSNVIVSDIYERYVLSGTDISNGYLDVTNTMKATPEVMIFPDRVNLLPTDDFTWSGKRIVWNTATVGPGGDAALVAGDIIHVWYFKA